MPISELVIPPGSADITTFSVTDANKQPVDFTQGTWVAKVVITRYPGDLDPPLFEWTNATDMISLEPGKVLLHHDPTITYDFTRAHFDAYVQGPNIASKTVRIDHGPVRIDF